MVKIIKDVNSFEKAITNQFAVFLHDVLNDIIPNIEIKIREAVVQQIERSNEYNLLLSNGTNERDFGAIFGTNHLELGLRKMLEVFAGQIFVERKVRKQSGKISVKTKFNVVRGNFSAVSKIEEGHYTSYPSGKEIEWLKWILKEGFKTIAEYAIDFNLSPTAKARSRTGRAIMRRLGQKRFDLGLRSWRVPEPFYGDDETDNFVVRALTSQSFLSKLESIFMSEFRKWV